MAVTVSTLIEAKTATNSTTTQYTSTGLKTIIDKFTVSHNNGSGSPAYINVSLVPSGGTADGTNVIMYKLLQPQETYTCPELVGQVLSAGDFIATVASVTNLLVIRASGRLVS